MYDSALQIGDMGFEVTVERLSRTSWFDTIGVYQGLVLAAAAILIIVLSAFFFKKHNRDDAVWKVQQKDIIFDDPPESVGRGTFGLILKAEYRGTQVAVKRIMPPKTDSTNRSGSANGVESRFQSAFGEDSKSGEGTKSGLHQGTSQQGGTMNLTWGSMPLHHGTPFRGKKMSQAAKWKKLRKDFIEEMRYISKLRHPCITTVMGTKLNGSSLFHRCLCVTDVFLL